MGKSVRSDSIAIETNATMNEDDEEVVDNVMADEATEATKVFLLYPFIKSFIKSFILLIFIF